MKGEYDYIRVNRLVETCFANSILSGVVGIVNKIKIGGGLGIVLGIVMGSFESISPPPNTMFGPPLPLKKEVIKLKTIDTTRF